MAIAYPWGKSEIYWFGEGSILRSGGPIFGLHGHGWCMGDAGTVRIGAFGRPGHTWFMEACRGVCRGHPTTDGNKRFAECKNDHCILFEPLHTARSTPIACLESEPRCCRPGTFGLVADPRSRLSLGLLMAGRQRHHQPPTSTLQRRGGRRGGGTCSRLLLVCGTSAAQCRQQARKVADWAYRGTRGLRDGCRGLRGRGRRESVLGSWGKTMRGAGRNKERWVKGAVRLPKILELTLGSRSQRCIRHAIPAVPARCAPARQWISTHWPVAAEPSHSARC